MRVLRSTVLAISVTAGALFVPGTARAHDMNAKVEVRPDLVRVDVYFDGNFPAESATVSVTDDAGIEIATGTADERGVWTFPPPGPGNYLLTAKHEGHVAKVPFTVAGPEAPPATYTGARLNKAVGLTAGVGGLLGVSTMFWLKRRRRRE